LVQKCSQTATKIAIYRLHSTLFTETQMAHKETWSSWVRLRFWSSPSLMAPTPASASVRFHKLIFSFVFVCLKLNGKWMISSTQN